MKNLRFRISDCDERCKETILVLSEKTETDLSETFFNSEIIRNSWFWRNDLATNFGQVQPQMTYLLERSSASDILTNSIRRLLTEKRQLKNNWTNFERPVILGTWFIFRRENIFFILKLFPGQSVTKTSVEHHGIFGSWFEIMNRDFCSIRPHRCIHSICTGINFEFVSARNFFNPGTTGLGIYEKNY